MDEQKFVTSITNIQPTHLIIGPSDEVVAHTLRALQHIFCVNNRCTTCVQCRMIMNHEHHSIMWFGTQTYYTREYLEPLFDRLSFQSEPNEQFFFVLQDADFLTPACANSLLKSLEEPPSGYRFILCAERKDSLLPTILSRCMIHEIVTHTPHSIHHPLFDYFTSITFHDPASFLKTLDMCNPTERESMTLLDSLFSHWTRAYAAASTRNNPITINTCAQVLQQLHIAYQQPPMTGSSKLFWKNLFLTIKKESTQ